MSTILKVTNASKMFGGLVANRNISFEIEKGTIYGIVGPNGAGKTTLFNSISRAHNLTYGKIEFEGRDITRSKPYEVCKWGLCRTYQIPQTLNDMTVLENVLIGALCHRSNIKEALEYSEEITKYCNISKLNNVSGDSLNVAQKKRLEIARALATDPELMLLDETMAGLHGIERQEAIDLIRKINKKGITILMIEHVMQVIMSVSERIMVLVSGQKLMEGTPKEVTTNEDVIKAYLGGGYNAIDS